MHCVHKKRFVCFRIIRWLLASLRIVLSRLMYLTVIYITVKCFMYYVDFNLPPEYHNFCCDSNPLPLSLQRENENSFSLKTLWDKHDFFFKSLAISHNNSLQARNRLRANFSFVYLLELSFIHQELSFRRPWKRPKTLACLRWFPQKGKES